MAIGGTCVWEVRTGGSDTNGGGYTSGGTDWSQQDAAQYSVTDGVTAGTTTITSATANFGTDVVGNVMYVQGGTGSVTAGWYQIISRTNATTIVVDRSTGLTAGTGVTLKIGGAFATPGAVPAVAVTGNYVWIKSGTYTITTSTAGPSGPVNFTSNILVIVEGYETTRGDRTGVRPIISAGAIASVTLFRMACTNQQSHPRNIEVDGNANAAIVGIAYAGYQQGPIDCRAYRCVTGFSLGANICVVRCIVDTCTSFGLVGTSVRCIARNCTGYAFYGHSVDSVAINSGKGFSDGGVPSSHQNCIASGCTDGFFFDGATARVTRQIGCIARNCTRGFTVGTWSQMEDCAGYGNTTNVSGTPTLNRNFTSLGADPIVSATDFTLTSTAAALLLTNQWLGEIWKQYAGAVPPAASGGSGIPIARGMHGGMR